MTQEHFLNQLLPCWSGSDESAKIQLYLQSPVEGVLQGQSLPCIVLCPGGGYRFTSDREAEPVALRFLSMGYQVAVLRYSVAPHRFPTQLCEAAVATAWLRRHARELCMDANRVAVCGFSAGGHVAASLATLYRHPAVSDALGLAPEETRPNAAVLCYPVITGGAFAHTGSFEALLGADDTPQGRTALSLEHCVTADCPPCFLWHTANDAAVPVENSLLFVQALSRCNVPFALHIFPSGVHGLSLADASTATQAEQIVPDAAQWPALCADFLQTYL